MNTVTLTHGRGWLAAPAAASLHRIDREIGHPLDINEAGRTWARQDAHYQRYQDYLNGGPWAPIALPPGSSIHEFGRAIDTDEQITDVLNRHGWRHTVYRGGVLVEPWHYEYSADEDQHINEQEDDMFTEADRAMLKAVREQLGGANNRKTSLRQDIDQVIRRLKRIEAAVKWIKKRIGGSVLNGAKNLTALIRGGK